MLYRRWANKDRLVLAALEHHRTSNPIEAPDTGTLRGDVLAELTAAAAVMAGFYAIVIATSGSGLLVDSGLTPAQVRQRIVNAQALPELRPAYRRAHDRGEIDLARIPPAVLAMPFDLLRHDLLTAVDRPDPIRIRSIVDELFMPLIERWSS